MTRFIIDARETVFYTVEIEAESQELLNKMIQDGDIDFGTPVDGDNFIIDEIKEIG